MRHMMIRVARHYHKILCSNHIFISWLFTKWTINITGSTKWKVLTSWQDWFWHLLEDQQQAVQDLVSHHPAIYGCWFQCRRTWAQALSHPHTLALISHSSRTLGWNSPLNANFAMYNKSSVLIFIVTGFLSDCNELTLYVCPGHH